MHISYNELSKCLLRRKTCNYVYMNRVTLYPVNVNTNVSNFSEAVTFDFPEWHHYFQADLVSLQPK